MIKRVQPENNGAFQTLNLDWKYEKVKGTLNTFSRSTQIHLGALKIHYTTNLYKERSS